MCDIFVSKLLKTELRILSFLFCAFANHGHPSKFLSNWAILFTDSVNTTEIGTMLFFLTVCSHSFLKLLLIIIICQITVTDCYLPVNFHHFVLLNVHRILGGILFVVLIGVVAITADNLISLLYLNTQMIMNKVIKPIHGCFQYLWQAILCSPSSGCRCQ